MHIFRPVGFYLILHKYTEGSGAYGPFPLYHLSFHYFLNQLHALIFWSKVRIFVFLGPQRSAKSPHLA